MFDELLESDPNRPKTNKSWTVMVSAVLQMVILTILILIPLIYTEALPMGSVMSTILVAPPPPPPPPPPPVAVQVVRVKPVARLMNQGVLRAQQTVRTAHGDGLITSGSFAPTLNRSIAIARVPAAVTAGDTVEVDVRGKGLMIGIELVRDRKTKERAPEERNAVVQAMFRRGVLVLGAGKNALRLAPPLVLSKDQAGVVLETMDEALAEVGATRSARL